MHQFHASGLSKGLRGNLDRWITYNNIGLQGIENCALAPSVEGVSSNVTANSPVLLVFGEAM